MLGINIIRKSITLLTAIAVWSAFSMAVIAAPSDVMGEITVTGQVTVNGQSVVSNATLTSGSVVTTGTAASAVINLGKNGRVEVLSDSSLTLNFADNSIVGMLASGKIRVSNAAGIATTITTRNSTIIADSGQANTFGIDVGCGDEERCTQTYVETTTGLVTLRNGSNDKQVAAGTDATYGNPSQTGCKPCLRPGTAAPVVTAGLGAGAIAAILLAAAGAVGAAVLLGSDNETEVGGGAIVISPSR
ncbi:MAG: hypothetical protein M3R11_02130 [Acidobacteriota bacterium]|jgi:hypothetical protein|nr:hypothetical protein [Acidobacteriota bacterium]